MEMDNNLKTKIQQCNQTAEEFTKLYYESVDKRRHQIGRLYLDNGLLVWNGNGITGKDNIQKFLLELPTSEHQAQLLDAQPIIDEATSAQLTFVIQTSGMIRFYDQPARPFQQTFIITSEYDKWKIVSDCFRLQDSMNITTRKTSSSQNHQK